MRHVTLIIVATACAYLASLTSVPSGHAGTAVLLDDFNDNSVQTAHWQPLIIGAGVTTAEANGRLEVEFESTAAGSLFMGGLRSACALVGDFDMQVDFELLDWPAANGVRVGLSPAEVGAMERTGDGGGFYLTDFLGSQASVATTDMAGKLRVTRVGSTFSGYYDDAGMWTFVGSASGSTSDGQTISLQAWSHDPFFGDAFTRIAFDNIIINSGSFVCPLQGDVDCSGAVNAVDSLKVLRHNAALSVAQTEPCPAISSPLTHPFGDVDCAGGVNAVDALKILRDNAALSVDQTEPCVDIRQPLYVPGP